MFKTAYQRGFFTLLSSMGSKPLDIWEEHVKNGYINRFLDEEIKSLVLEIGGINVSTTYIICPKGNAVLGITMPFLIMIVKNLHKYFTFEVTILDDDDMKRRFRVANFQSTTSVTPTCTVMPICLDHGWNQIHFNLADFTYRAYKKQYVELQKIKINANIRLKRIYMTDRLYRDDELPPDFKLYLAPSKAKKKGQTVEADTEKENIPPEPHAEPPQSQYPDFRRRSSSRSDGPQGRRQSSKPEFPDFRRRRSSDQGIVKKKQEVQRSVQHSAQEVRSDDLTVLKESVSKMSVISDGKQGLSAADATASGPLSLETTASRVNKLIEMSGQSPQEEPTKDESEPFEFIINVAPEPEEDLEELKPKYGLGVPDRTPDAD